MTAPESVSSSPPDRGVPDRGVPDRSVSGGRAVPGRVDRRRFLRGLALGAGGSVLVGGGGLLAACSGSSDGAGTGVGGGGSGADDVSSTPASRPLPVSAAALAARTLIVLELEGGNDGLDTLVPYGDGRYVDLRSDIGVDPATVLSIDDEVGLNPVLASLHAQGFAVVEGVGMADPDLSHFESSRRWWQGDMTGTATDDTGFLGRLCDVLAGDEAVTGLSIGRASSPMLRSQRAVTLGLTDTNGGGWLSATDDPYIAAVRAGLATMMGGRSGPVLAGAVRTNTGRALDFVDVMGSLPEHAPEMYPDGALSDALRTTAQLLASDLGIRVFHIPWGSFDTHDDHRSSHDDQLTELDAAVAAFREDLADLGLDDSTLIATTSEFGRRVEANRGGTDHGAASCMLLAGPVQPGRHGEAPSLGSLDDDGNLVATVTMDEYYATLAEEWFGVPADDVLLAGAKPIGNVIARA